MALFRFILDKNDTVKIECGWNIGHRVKGD